MNIYIIRHGETNANVEGRLQGWTDTPLNEMGVLLAVETGRAMKGMHFDAAYSSSLSRAKMTAEIILKETENNIDIQIDDRIKEICMGDWEGARIKAPNSRIPPEILKDFFTNPLSLPEFPHGESLQQVMERSQSFLKELAKKDYENVLVATHGCAVRCMLNFLYDNPSDFWHGHVPFNCCINVVEVKNGKMSLIEDDMVLYDERFCVDRYE